MNYRAVLVSALAGGMLLCQGSAFAMQGKGGSMMSKPFMPRPRSLDKVCFQLTDRTWVKVKTAKVIVNIYMAADNKGLETVHARMMSALSDLSASKGEDAASNWQITSFSRSQDSSGLEQINAVAEKRLPLEQLANLRETARKLSKPGMKFDLSNIEYTPSFEAMQQAKSDLREKVYEQVKAEIGRLNAVYPDAHYSVHKIMFFDSRPPMMTFEARRMMGAANAMVMAKMSDSLSAPSMPVGNQVYVYANVTLASRMTGKS